MQENNWSELERLDKERHDDFLSMLKGFIINQVLLLLNGFKALDVRLSITFGEVSFFFFFNHDDGWRMHSFKF